MLVLSPLQDYDYSIASPDQYAQISAEIDGVQTYGELFIDHQYGLVLTVNDEWYAVADRSPVRFILDFIARTATTVDDIAEVWSEGQNVEDIADFLEQTWSNVQENHMLMQIHVRREVPIIAA